MTPLVRQQLHMSYRSPSGMKMAYTEGDTTEVVKMIGATQPDQQLDLEPPVNRMMSPPLRRAREEDYLKGEVHGIPSASVQAEDMK